MFGHVATTGRTLARFRENPHVELGIAGVSHIPPTLGTVVAVQAVVPYTIPRSVDRNSFSEQGCVDGEA